MTELEKIAYAKTFIDKLANGINPLDDTPVKEDDVVNNVRLSRCFFYVSDILKQVIENGGAYVEISVPTWLLAVATVAVGVACVYNPAVAAYIAKIIASIRSTARAAAAALVPIFPHIVKAAA